MNASIRNEKGQFIGGPRSYASLLDFEPVKMFSDSYPPKNRGGQLYNLQHFFEINGLTPEEALGLKVEDVKKAIKKAVLHKRAQGFHSVARLLFYSVLRFYELQDITVPFNRTEKKALLNSAPLKVAKEHVPSREEIYRMADSFPKRNPLQQARGKAVIICLWQSGVRASCLCTWTWGIFEKQLYPMPQVPVKIKVVSRRPRDVYDCAEDTKLSGYNLGYYYTFLHEEAAKALKHYLDLRVQNGWQPKPEDPVFVTEGALDRGEPLKNYHVNDLVKNAAKQIGLNPESVWTHCLRKAFRKTLYKSGIDPDISEALMGHKLSGSKGNYFDYHDIQFVMDEYLHGQWSRINVDHVRRLEEEVATVKQLKEKNEELEKRLNQIAQETREADLGAAKKEIDDIRQKMEQDIKEFKMNALRDMVKAIRSDPKLREQFRKLLT